MKLKSSKSSSDLPIAINKSTSIDKEKELEEEIEKIKDFARAIRKLRESLIQQGKEQVNTLSKKSMSQ